MKDMKKILSITGISRKAGKMILGTEKVISEIRKGRKNSVKLVLIASDVSENTRKKISNACGFYNVPTVFIESDKTTFGHRMGANGELSVAGITDSGLAAAVKKADIVETNEQE